MNIEIKQFLLKLVGLIIVSPLVGFIVLDIIKHIEIAKKAKGKKKWLALSIIGILIGILLGWLR